MTFGAKIKVLDNDWLTECRDLSAVVTSGGETRTEDACITTSGIIQETEFTTEPAETCYPITWWEEFKNIDFAFELKIDGGTAEPLYAGGQTVKVDNGFRANPIPIINPLNIGDMVNIFAQPSPRLETNQSRIRYEWNLQPGNIGHLVSLGYPGGYGQRLVADSAGIINLSYTIRDTVSATYATSSPRQVVIKPTINITSPTAGQKFTFDQQNTGTCILHCSATTGNSRMDQEIEWSITPMPTSKVISNPSPPRGPNVTFAYSRLPVNNYEFGSKYVKAEIPHYSAKDSEMVKIYFPKTATNHPAPGNGTAPNWYYYWKQPLRVADSSFYGGDSCNTSRVGYYHFSQIIFHNCDLAAESDTVLCAAHRFSGIDMFAADCYHEKQHLNDYDAWWRPIGGYINNINLDSDLDRVLNSAEPALGFDSTLQDSDGDSFIDFEDRGYDAQCHWIPGTADSSDWANPGHQH